MVLKKKKKSAKVKTKDVPVSVDPLFEPSVCFHSISF